ncbi:MAG: class I SAM-dependent RNA methyltransferase [Gemmatimonadota bacterium]
MAVWRMDEGGSRRVVGPEVLTEDMLGEGVEIRGTAFLQVNRKAGEALQLRLLDLIGDPADLRIVEAYCGVGMVGRRLARKGARVTGIEMDGEAVRGARAGAPAGQEIVEGRVEEHLSHTLPADLVLLNPPRTGLHESIPGRLAEEPPPRIVYVSCDSATLARDLARLSAGYEIRTLEAFDLFPQTAHVEVVVDLARKDP